MTVPQLLFEMGKKRGDAPIQFTKNGGKEFHQVSWNQWMQQVAEIGCALHELGVKRGDKVGIIADNRAQWLVTDVALLALGAVDVPRGADSTSQEIRYILNHSESVGVFCEDCNQWEKIANGQGENPQLDFCVLFQGEPPTEKVGKTKMYSWAQLNEIGKKSYPQNTQLFEEELAKGKEDDLATIIYTSGTTGEPKGVMLAHRSFIFQIQKIKPILDIKHTDVMLSVLPIWHSFERAVEYIILCHGGSVAYSKPQGKILIEDMAMVNPTYFPSVPRIWEGVLSAVMRNVKTKSPVQQALFHFFLGVGKVHADLLMLFEGRVPQYHIPSFPWDRIFSFFPLILITPLNLLGNLLVFNKLKKLLGKRFRAGISGGGALPSHVDHFFRAVGINVLEGYGLTETGPVLCCRMQYRPVPRTVGPLLDGIDYKIVTEDGREVKHGEKGVLLVKSPQVMLGYYKNPQKTAEVLKDGWLNTGDLVIGTIHREIRIVGRAKDTIVLRGGENIEPEPIEQVLLQSEAIEQVMVVGQDQKTLGALIVPNWDVVERVAKERRISYYEKEELLQNDLIRDYFNTLIQNMVNANTGFKAFERITRFALLENPFEPLVEMTATLKLKRNVIAQRKEAIIRQMFAEG